MDTPDSRDSSPDPLTLSWNNTYTMRPSLSPQKSDADWSLDRQRYLLRESSSNVPQSPKQQQRTLVFTSPSREGNKRGSSKGSPWRIKVIVQADQEEMTAQRSPMGKKTTTTKIPLKGEDEHYPVKRRSTRSRYSAGGDSLSNTPHKEAKKKSGTTPQKKRKLPNDLNIGETAVAVSSPTRATTEKRMKSNNAAPAPSIEVASKLRNFSALTPLHEKPENGHLLWKPDIIDYTPFGQEGSTKRRLRERVPTPRKPAGYNENSLSPLPFTSPVATPTRTGIAQDSNHDDSPDHGTESSLQSDNEGDEEEDSSIMGGMQDDTSVLDRSLAASEGFSMVSIESLKSQRLLVEAISGGRPATAQSKPQTVLSNTIAGNSTPATTSAINESQSQTTDIDLSPDQITPRAPIYGNSQEQDQRVSQLRSAGANSQRIRRTKMNHRHDDPFEAFGIGTKRELSAGLAKGELLARGERGFITQQMTNSGERTTETTEIDGQPDTSSCARLPTPSETASSSGSGTSPVSPTQNEDPGKGNIGQSFSGEDGSKSPAVASLKDYSMMSWRPTTPTPAIVRSPELSRSEKFERQWQLEREEVIQQAEQANSSQVVYINSEDNTLEGEHETDFDEEMTEVNDIWQEEAERSLEESASSLDLVANRKPQKEQKGQTLDLNEILGEDTRPLRAKIPRTWRQTSGNHFLYSDEAESPSYSSPKALGLKLDHSTTKVISRYSNMPLQQFDSNGDSTHAQRDVSPPKGILSSPERREQQSNETPKEVRFARRIPGASEAEEYEFADAEYFSSESSVESSLSQVDGLMNRHDTPIHDCVENTGLHENHSFHLSSACDDLPAVQTSGLRQLQLKLKAMATPRGRVLANAPVLSVEESHRESNGLLMLKPAGERKYEKLFDNSPQPPRPAKKQKADPGHERHVRSSRTITIELAESKTTDAHPRGIFGLVASWLYPPIPAADPKYTYTQDWNRNHYLVLNDFWLRSFRAPYYLEPVQSSSAAQANTLSLEFERLVAARITRFGGEQPLVLTYAHCTVALQFVVEVRDRGLPLLCDGRRKVPKYIRKRSPDYDPAQDSSNSDDDGSDAEEWPRRDSSGRVARLKQEWTAEEAVKGVYGLWLTKSHEAAVVRAKEKTKGASRV